MSTSPSGSSARVPVGTLLVSLGGAGLLVFLAASLAGRDVNLWPNPLFIGFIVMVALGGFVLLWPLISRARAWARPVALPPSSDVANRQWVEHQQWGDARYRARHEHNPQEGALYLTLECRDPGTLSVRVVVHAPGERVKDQFAQSGSSVTNRYPQDFEDSKRSTAPGGKYRVEWYMLVELGGNPKMRKVATERFTLAV